MKTARKFTRTRKGSEQPIWLLVAVILALVIGAALYQLVLKSIGQQTFANMFKNMDIDTAETNMKNYCNKWKENGWNVPLNKDDYEVVRRASVFLGWVTKDEYFGSDPRTSTCDCAAYLLKNNLISSDREVLKAVSTTNQPILNIEDAIIASTSGGGLRAEDTDDKIPKKCHYKAICYLGQMLGASSTQQATVDEACKLSAQ